MSSGRSQRVNFRWVLVAGGLVLVLSSAYVFLSTGGSCPIAPTTRNCDATLKTMVTIFTIAGLGPIAWGVAFTKLQRHLAEKSRAENRFEGR